MLCNRCLSIRFRCLDEVTSQAPPREQENEVFYILHETRQSLSASISNGCHFCILVRAQVGTVEISSSVCDKLSAYLVLRMQTFPGQLSATAKFPTLGIVSRLGNAILNRIEDLPDSYAALLDKHAQSYTAQSPGSKFMNIALAKLWRDECLANHSLCGLGSPDPELAPLPTRLLDVTNPEKPVLKEIPSGTTGTYVALSYCWGQVTQLETTRGNYLSHKRGILSSRLPQTIRDAVSVANWLGYKHIWIDALCIIQDDDSDMRRELDKMGDIYRYAALTISAQRAASSHGGLFNKIKNPLSLSPCKITVRLVTDGVLDDFELPQEVTFAGTCNGPNHLKSRGWVLQEEVLTSRSLIFGSQMAWQCTGCNAQETNPAATGDRHNSPLDSSWATATSIFWIRIVILASEQLRETLPSFVRLRSNHFDVWYLMVQEYSDRELSFAKDTLRALSGLSVLFERRYQTTYLAGLWQEDLIKGLGWYVAFNETRGIVRQTAPTWSWASVGKVRIRFYLQSGFLTSQRIARATVLAAHCPDPDPLHSRPLLVTNGIKIRPHDWFIRLQGLVKEALLCYEATYEKWRVDVKTFRQAGRDNQGAEWDAFQGMSVVNGVHPRFPALLRDAKNEQRILGEAALDLQPLSQAKEHEDPQTGMDTEGKALVTPRTRLGPRIQVSCLILEDIERHGERHAVCLLLVPRFTGSSSFLRLGLGFVSAKDWLKGSGQDTMMDCEVV